LSGGEYCVPRPLTHNNRRPAGLCISVVEAPTVEVKVKIDEKTKDIFTQFKESLLNLRKVMDEVTFGKEYQNKPCPDEPAHSFTFANLSEEVERLKGKWELTDYLAHALESIAKGQYHQSDESYLYQAKNLIELEIKARQRKRSGKIK